MILLLARSDDSFFSTSNVLDLIQVIAPETAESSVPSTCAITTETSTATFAEAGSETTALMDTGTGNTAATVAATEIGTSATTEASVGVDLADVTARTDADASAIVDADTSRTTEAAVTATTGSTAATIAAETPKIYLPEGATIHVMKPEVWIRFLPIDSLPGATVNSLPDETVVMKFKLTDNISAVKGRAVERVVKHLSSDAQVDYDRILVTRSSGESLDHNPTITTAKTTTATTATTTTTIAGGKLDEKQMLIDFVFPRYIALTVHYQKDGISFRERKPSVDLDPECLFSLFHSDL